MTITDILSETYISLSSNKVRSGLTMLGVVIGIGSVIAMISIGQGATGSITSSIEGLGSNLLSVSPGFQQSGRGVVSQGRGSAQTLLATDADALAKIPGVAHVSAELSSRFQITAQNGNNTNSQVYGVTTEYLPVRNATLDFGSFVTDAHIRSLSKIVVLGSTVASDLFPDGDAVGKTVRINKSNFKIVGIMTAKGGTGFSSPDELVFVPLSTMQKILTGSEYVSGIGISVETKEQMNDVKILATTELATRHKVDEENPDFRIVSQADVLGTLSQVTATLTIFLASIAGISLLVGGIGIMNMMLTTVTERTREIGLRKALGAKRRDIIFQFLAEAIMLTFIGGILGVILGVLVAYGVSLVANMNTQVSFSSVFLAFGVSAGIGIVFGYYPARRASLLNPIEALRYE